MIYNKSYCGLGYIYEYLMVGGYLYIITNNAWPGYIKVGVTKNLKSRLKSYQTCSPYRDYVLRYSLYHPDYLVAERRIKDTMRPFAKSIKNEWFEVDYQVAVTRLTEQLENSQ